MTRETRTRWKVPQEAHAGEKIAFSSCLLKKKAKKYWKKNLKRYMNVYFGVGSEGKIYHSSVRAKGSHLEGLQIVLWRFHHYCFIPSNPKIEIYSRVLKKISFPVFPLSHPSSICLELKSTKRLRMSYDRFGHRASKFHTSKWKYAGIISSLNLFFIAMCCEVFIDFDIIAIRRWCVFFISVFCFCFMWWECHYVFFFSVGKEPKGALWYSFELLA